MPQALAEEREAQREVAATHLEGAHQVRTTTLTPTTREELDSMIAVIIRKTQVATATIPQTILPLRILSLTANSTSLLSLLRLTLREQSSTLTLQTQALRRVRDIVQSSITTATRIKVATIQIHTLIRTIQTTMEIAVTIGTLTKIVVMIEQKISTTSMVHHKLPNKLKLRPRIKTSSLLSSSVSLNQYSDFP